MKSARSALEVTSESTLIKCNSHIPYNHFSKLFKMTADDGIIPPTVQKNAVGSMLRMLVHIFSSVAQEFISRRPVTTLPGQSFSKVYDSA